MMGNRKRKNKSQSNLASNMTNFQLDSDSVSDITIEQLNQSINRFCNKVSSLEETIKLKDKRIDELE